MVFDFRQEFINFKIQYERQFPSNTFLPATNSELRCKFLRHLIPRTFFDSIPDLYRGVQFRCWCLTGNDHHVFMLGGPVAFQPLRMGVLREFPKPTVVGMTLQDREIA